MGHSGSGALPSHNLSVSIIAANARGGFTSRSLVICHWIYFIRLIITSVTYVIISSDEVDISWENCYPKNIHSSPLSKTKYITWNINNFLLKKRKSISWADVKILQFVEKIMCCGLNVVHWLFNCWKIMTIANIDQIINRSTLRPQPSNILLSTCTHSV